MTYEEIINDAWGLSTKNVPGQTASEHPELTGVIHRSLKALYTIAASVNPTFFGAQQSVAGASGSWTVPARAEMVFYVEDPDGDEVIVVRYDERDADPKKPAVYQLGSEVYPAGNTPDPDPASDALTFFYAEDPGTAPGAKTDSLPSSWDDSHANLLVLQTGIYLARKDSGPRQGELEALAQERNRELARFIRKLENFQSNLVSRFGGRTIANTESVISHRELLSGAIGGGS